MGELEIMQHLKNTLCNSKPTVLQVKMYIQLNIKGEKIRKECQKPLESLGDDFKVISRHL